MSKLSAKLQRLSRGANPTVRGETTCEAARSDAVRTYPKLQDDGAHGGVEGSQAIERLRQQMAEIMGKAALAPPSRVWQGESHLPFVERETLQGPLWVRFWEAPHGHFVGRGDITAAYDCNMRMLALLALDPSLESLDPAKALYLDTETTGLSGGTGTLPFLIGLGYFRENGRFCVEQLMLRHLDQEQAMLGRVAELWREASMLVTYNGKSFDVPLIRTRNVMCQLPELQTLPHLDLLHVARRIHKARLVHCDLAHVEARVLGFEREGDVVAAEIPSRYFHYLRTGDDQGLGPVVQHNLWDIVTMAALVGLYGNPLEHLLHGEDLAGAAMTTHRAQRKGAATETTQLITIRLADEAVARAGGVVARKARAAIAKSLGRKDAALADFESVAQNVDDPLVRLELAKLYEHHAKSYDKALAMVRLGVAEDEAASHHRMARIERKLERKPVC